MVNSVDRSLSTLLEHVKKHQTPFNDLSFRVHGSVHSINLAPFVHILSYYRHSIIECMVHVWGPRSQYGLV